MDYIRWAKENVQGALKKRRVVIISGPRQCGKTTLTRQVAAELKQPAIMRTLDDPELLALALDDPLNFVRHASGTMIIDEIQKAPKLLPALKMIVDNNNTCGQFILTGSADVQSLPDVTESLAGRIKNIHLKTLTNGEVLFKKPDFLQNCFVKNFPTQLPGWSKTDLVDLAFTGGYPEVVRLTKKDRKDWFKDYTNTILKKDLRTIANIGRQDTLAKLFKLLLSWSGKFMDTSAVAAALAISRNTLASYINILKTLFLFEVAPPWTNTDYARAGRREKIFAADTGLMANILDWQKDAVLLNSDRCGKLIETLVFNELAVQTELSSACVLYHYRDREKREIDFIIENSHNKLLAIEVKAGASVSPADFKHIQWFRTNLARGKKVIGIVLYSGEQTLPFKKDNYAVPLAMLWQ
jgi:predicted AAA+ superfamily ATPase